jgi:uncharacterized protein (TIGR02268 family)
MEAAVTPSEVRISPGIATLLLFDSVLDRAGTMLEGREHFREVDVGERTIVLLPSETARDKEKLLLTVRFADGQPPATAIFILKPHPALAEHQLEVYRHLGACEACLQQASEQQVALEQCRVQLSRCAVAPRPPVSISELLSSGFMDWNGIQVHDIQRPSSSHDLLKVTGIRSYRTLSRAAVQVGFRPKKPEGTRSWIAKSATLVDRQGKSLETLTVRQSEPGDATAEIFVWVETEMDPLPTTYTLTLQDAEGTHPIIVNNVRFP